MERELFFAVSNVYVFSLSHLLQHFQNYVSYKVCYKIYLLIDNLIKLVCSEIKTTTCFFDRSFLDLCNSQIHTILENLFDVQSWLCIYLFFFNFQIKTTNFMAQEFQYGNFIVEKSNQCKIFQQPKQIVSKSIFTIYDFFFLFLALEWPPER